MTWPNPWRPAPAEPTAVRPPDRSAPLARVSRGALAANAGRLVARHPSPVADVRRDAWGHGLDAAAEALRAAGARDALVDEAAEARAVSLGLRPVRTAATDPELLYGLPGSGGVPALALVTPVLSTKALRAGEGVSYGYTHRAPADTRVALIAGGYAEGVVRALGNNATVDIGGVLRPIVGRVAMDVCVVDVGDQEVVAGDEAVFFGAGAALDGLARWSAATALTPAELVCAVGLHADREVVA